MMRPFLSLPVRARDWWTSRQPRERALLALALAIGASLLAIKAQEGMTAARLRAEAAVMNRTAGEGVARRQQDAFVRVVQEAAREARRGSMGGETIHIARARAQSLVAALAQQAGLNDATVTVRPRDAKPKRGPLEAIELVVIGAYDKAAFARFLQLLSVSEQSLSPMSVNVRAGDAPRLEVRVCAYAIRGGDET